MQYLPGIEFHYLLLRRKIEASKEGERSNNFGRRQADLNLKGVEKKLNKLKRNFKKHVHNFGSLPTFIANLNNTFSPSFLLLLFSLKKFYGFVYSFPQPFFSLRPRYLMYPKLSYFLPSEYHLSRERRKMSNLTNLRLSGFELHPLYVLTRVRSLPFG